MRRLIANNTSIEQYIEIEEQIKDDTLKSRYLRQQATMEFNVAKKIVNLINTAPTNHLIYKVYNWLLDGTLDINWEINDLISQTIYLLKEDGTLIDYCPDNTMKYKTMNQAMTGNDYYKVQ